MGPDHQDDGYRLDQVELQLPAGIDLLMGKQ